MVDNRYEVVRQDNGARLWYVWDSIDGEEVCDDFGNPIYYNSFKEAEAAVLELNAHEYDEFIKRFEIRRETHGLYRWYVWDKKENKDILDKNGNTKYFLERVNAEDFIQDVKKILWYVNHS